MNWDHLAALYEIEDSQVPFLKRWLVVKPLRLVVRTLIWLLLPPLAWLERVDPHCPKV